MSEEREQEREQERERAGGGGQLSAAARRERLQELAAALGERAVSEGERLILESGGAVALYVTVEPDGDYRLTWWQTATAPDGHPRWREAAATLTQPGEAIYTSALGGGFLVELERRATSVDEARRLANEPTPVERVAALAAAFPEALGQLPPEPVPAYLLPPEPEEP